MVQPPCARWERTWQRSDEPSVGRFRSHDENPSAGKLLSQVPRSVVAVQALATFTQALLVAARAWSVRDEEIIVVAQCLAGS